MMNLQILQGRLTRDPELRRTKSGIPVVSFTVACERDIATNGQERETDFLDCVAWRSKAEFIAKYFRKGSMILVVGRTENRRWTDEAGNKRVSNEVNVEDAYFGDSVKRGPGASQDDGYPNQPGADSGTAPQNAPGNGYPAPNYAFAGSAPAYAPQQANSWASPAPTNQMNGAGAYPPYPAPAAPAAYSDMTQGMGVTPDEELPY